MNRLRIKVAAIAAATLCVCPVYAAPQKKKPVKVAAAAVVSANPRQENQFVTVDEFVHGTRAPKTAVSIEGYAVSAFRAADGSLRMVIVDSIDHVLSPTDADNFGKGGAAAIAPATIVAKHPAWAWTPKGMQRLSMYAANGVGRAQRQLHDIVPKVRITGFATGRLISPLTKIEFQDDNGEWKTL